MLGNAGSSRSNFLHLACLRPGFGYVTVACAVMPIQLHKLAEWSSTCLIRQLLFLGQRLYWIYLRPSSAEAPRGAYKPNLPNAVTLLNDYQTYQIPRLQTPDHAKQTARKHSIQQTAFIVLSLALLWSTILSTSILLGHIPGSDRATMSCLAEK